MPKGYLIANVDVTDAEAYKAYIAENAVAFAKYHGRFLVRAGQREVPEGAFRALLVVLEFPSFQAAQDCYHSPEYAKAIALREGASIADIALAEAYAGPQVAPFLTGQRDGPKGYWIVLAEVSDPEGYKDYVAATAASSARYGARYLVRGGASEVPEGKFPSRIVVMEFPSPQAAAECYHSPEYARAITLRQGKAQMNLAIIWGYDGPQPGNAARP